MRAATGGQAFPQSVFDHWQVMAGDASEEGTMPNKIVVGIRKRKGLSENVPGVENYYDKL